MIPNLKKLKEEYIVYSTGKRAVSNSRQQLGPIWNGKWSVIIFKNGKSWVSLLLNNWRLKIRQSSLLYCIYLHFPHIRWQCPCHWVKTLCASFLFFSTLHRPYTYTAIGHWWTGRFLFLHITLFFLLHLLLHVAVFHHVNESIWIL